MPSITDRSHISAQLSAHMCLYASLPQVHKNRQTTKQRGARGFGGAWRAWVRLKSWGQAGTPSFSALCDSYNEAKEQKSDEYKMACALGSSATRTGKRASLATGRSAFGPNKRSATRSTLSRLRSTAVVATQGLRAEQKAMQVASTMVAQGATVQQCLSVARSVMRRHSLEESKAAFVRAAALQTFRTGEGARRLQHLQATVPCLQQFEVFPIPSPASLPLFEFGRASSASATDAAAWAQQSRASNLSRCLGEAWQSLSQAVAGEESTSAPATGGVGDARPCIDAGICICSEDGKRLHQLRNRFQREMKRIFPPRSTNREALLAGKAVCALVSSESTEEVTADSEVVEDWLQVGYMQLSPYRPTFALMERAPPPLAADGPQARIFLKAALVVKSRGGSIEQCPGIGRFHMAHSGKQLSETLALPRAGMHISESLQLSVRLPTDLPTHTQSPQGLERILC